MKISTENFNHTQPNIKDKAPPIQNPHHSKTLKH